MAAVAIRRLTAQDATALAAFFERARDRGDVMTVLVAGGFEDLGEDLGGSRSA